jgi:2-dehydropantoate 2-reductase
MEMNNTNKQKRRFIVYGAGGIGSVVGGHLALAGNDVVLIGRSGHMKAIRENGLKLIKPNGTNIIKIEAVDSPAEAKLSKNDIILLTMKGQNTESAIQDLKRVISDIPVFCLQNGIRNEGIVSLTFPRTYGSRVNIGAVYMNDGEVICRRDPPGWLIMGTYPRGTDELVGNVGETLRQSDFYVLVTSDVMPFKWGKLMTNLGNAVGAITNGNFRDTHQITQAAQEEAGKILKEAEIRWLSEEQIRQEWPDFGAKPRSVMNTEEQSSTWQSLGRQQGTVETDFLNGEIVRVAQRLGKAAPINESITRITLEMAIKKEKPGKYSAEELKHIIGLV